MPLLLRRSGIIAILLLAAAVGYAQEPSSPKGASAPGGAPKPDADTGPRVVIGATPKPAPAPVQADPPRVADAGRMPNLNTLITEIVHDMPAGGGYATNAGSFAALRQGIRTNPQGHVNIDPAVVHPSFCSGATYLVLMGVVEELQGKGHLRLPPEVTAALEVRSQPDGVGIWGRWNANGPGTARLFHELGLGRNFTDFAEARPGDFIKMFWNEHIGSLERGHSAIFIGTSRDERGQETVTFWSSNTPGGFGQKTIPKANIKRALFSRLENPQGLANAARLPAKDDYLAAMLKRTSSPDEMLRMVGIGNRPPPAAPREEAARPASTPTPGDPASPGTPKNRPPAPTPSKQNVVPGNPPADKKAVPTQTPEATPEKKKGFLQKLFGK